MIPLLIIPIFKYVFMFKDKYISTRNTWNVLLWTKICLLVPSTFIKVQIQFAQIHAKVFISFVPPTCPQGASDWNGAGQTQCWSSSNFVWNALFYPLPYPHRTLCPKDPPHATVRHVRMVAYLAYSGIPCPYARWVLYPAPPHPVCTDETCTPLHPTLGSWTPRPQTFSRLQ